MKKALFTILLAAVLCPFGVSAQNRNTLAVSLGIPYESIFSQVESDTRYWDLYSGYEPRYIKDFFTPVIGLHYSRFVGEKIDIGALCAWGASSDRYYEPVEADFTQRRTLHNFCLMARTRYYYCERGYWRLYSGAGLGGKLQAEYTRSKFQTLKPSLAYEAVLLGLQETGPYPVFFELVFGNSSFIARAGVGITF